MNDSMSVTTMPHSKHEQYQKHELLINGKRVCAIFPKKPDENTMSIIKSILMDSHVKNAAKPCDRSGPKPETFDKTGFL